MAISPTLASAYTSGILFVEDYRRAKRFYEDVLGLRVTEDAQPPGAGVVTTGGGTRFELSERAGAMPLDSTMMGFAVADLAATLEDLRGRGVAPLDYDLPEMDLRTVDGVALVGDDVVAWFEDSEGNLLHVTQRRRRIRRPLTSFFLLTLVLFVPFWVLGALRPVNLLPGLPVAALAAFMPAVAAAILVYAEAGGRGVRALLARSYDFGRTRSKGWYVPVLLLMPAVMLIAYALLRAVGVDAPFPRITLPQTLLLSALFFVGALGEEFGWSGYAIDPMQERWGALRAALLLGVIWAAFHLVALAQVGRPANWIAFWTLQTIALRVLLTWLYDNTGRSVFAAALFHAAGNVTWQLFAVDGTLYYPVLTSLVVTSAAVVVVLVYGPTLVGGARRAAESS